MKLFKTILFFTLSAAISHLHSQNVFDCATSTITACNGNPTFPFTANNSGNTYGNVQDLPNNSTSTVSNPSTNPASTNQGCLLSGELNPTWVVINISAFGNLDFTISQTGFSDWALWPFDPANPTTSCGNITNNTLAPVRCNWNTANNGGTGLGTPPAGANPANFEPSLPVAVGQSYILLVSNYSNVNSTVNLNFGGSAGTSCVPTNSVIGAGICPGGTATISVSTSLANPSFTWNPGGLNTQTISVSPTNTTAYTVTVVGTNTVNAAVTTQTNTSNVTVYSIPNMTLSSNSMACPNSNISLTASSGFTNYAWTSPIGSQSTTINSTNFPNANPSLVGTYTVIGRTAQGCTATATTMVDIMPTSPVTVTPNPNACQGSVINLTADATGAAGYFWSGPNGYTSSSQNPVINNVQPSQAGIYTVTAGFIGVGSNTCTTTNTCTVSVTPAGNVPINPISTVCSNGDINLTAPNGGTAYEWSGPVGFTSSTQNPVINNAATVHQGVYSVSITTNGCVNTGTVNISVYNPLSFLSQPSNVTLCAGKTSTLSAVADGGSGVYNYQWTPINDLNSPNAPTTIVTGNTTTTYTLVVTDANCAITPTINTNAVVNVNPTPVITVTTSSARGCEPFCTDVIATSNPPSASCVWLFTNNLGTTQCNATNFCFPVRGVYNASLTVTDINGCVDSVKQTNFITVDPIPFPDFEWFPTNPNILVNEVFFTDKSTIGLPLLDWDWSFGDYLANGTDTTSKQNPKYLFQAVGSYPVTLGVTNSFGCYNSVTKQVIIEDDFVIYIPNTFSPLRDDGKNDVFIPQGMGFKAEGFEMAVYDRWGNQVFKTNDVTKGWDGSIKGGKPQVGTYVYKIKLRDYKNREKEFLGYITIM